MTHTKEKCQIRAFTSMQEEAAFWDTHDTADFEQAFKPVKVKFAPRLSEVLPIRLERTTLVEVQRRAREKGIGTTTLIRMWVLERLHETAVGAIKQLRHL